MTERKRKGCGLRMIVLVTNGAADDAGEESPSKSDCATRNFYVGEFIWMTNENVPHISKLSSEELSSNAKN